MGRNGNFKNGLYYAKSKEYKNVNCKINEKVSDMQEIGMRKLSLSKEL